MICTSRVYSWTRVPVNDGRGDIPVPRSCPPYSPESGYKPPPPIGVTNPGSYSRIGIRSLAIMR